MLSSALQTGQIQVIFRKQQFIPLSTLPPNLQLQRECELFTRPLEPVLPKMMIGGRRAGVFACSKPGLTGDNSNKEDKGRSWKQGWKSLSGIKDIGLLILITAAIMFARKWGNRSVPYSSFLEKISAKEVEKVVVDGAVLRFELKQKIGSEDNKKKTIVYTTKRPDDAKTPYRVMQEHDVEFLSSDNEWYWSLLKYMLIAGLCLNVLKHLSIKFLLKKLSGCEDNGDSGGEKIMFKDVAGVDEAKEELQEIVEFLRNPDRYTRLGARHPRGVLLAGRPGTGKTLLAKAVAGEAGVPFFACSASEFVELFVGMGALHVRNLFAQAKKKAPAIIFIDEIDAVGKSRGGRSQATNDEREQTLNQLLTEMDGFDSSSTVIVLAATNRADVLDEALCRPGRFDRLVTVEAPDKIGRQSILNVHVAKKSIPLGNDVDLAHIASITNGFTGAELANLINEAALLAVRQNKASVEKIDFTNALERSIAGIEKKSSRLVGEEKAMVACHEAGHAIVHTAVSRIISGQPAVEKLSIQPRSGGALGFTFMSPTTKNKHLGFVDELQGRLVGLLGGRAAEQVLYPDHVSTGAVDDLHQATKMTYVIVAEYGLHLTIGPISMSTLTNVGGGSMDQGQLGDLVQREVRSMLQSALNVAVCVIRANLTILEGLGARLEEKEKLEGEELQEWLNLVIAPFELAEFVRGKQDNNPLQTASESSQDQRLNFFKRAC